MAEELDRSKYTFYLKYESRDYHSKDYVLKRNENLILKIDNFADERIIPFYIGQTEVSFCFIAGSESYFGSFIFFVCPLKPCPSAVRNHVADVVAVVQPCYFVCIILLCGDKVHQ